MDIINQFLPSILSQVLPWLLFAAALVLMLKLIYWARQRKSAVIALGILIQMFLPDPNVEKTIKHVLACKQQIRKKTDENSEPITDN
ncbi:MAG: hypothetical protein HRT35_31345 [Algicola sp.]|nr:hypothetical protein [Algicola sp.]